MPERIAILCSDIHLSDKPPIARAQEPDWYEAMARPLRELRDLAGSLPVLCGGDVFDRWRSPPKLVNFAMRELPPYFYSVMGQHDLPYHNWELREDSAFWTLVEGNRIGLLGKEEEWVGVNDDLRDCGVVGFQWGEGLSSLDDHQADVVMVSVVHKYVWMNGARTEGVATKQNHLPEFEKKLEGFDVCLFGDNHKYFCMSEKGRTFFNPGTFMRRRSDDRDHQPLVGILHEDGTVVEQELSTNGEVFNRNRYVEHAENMLVSMDGFVEELRKMQDSGIRFEQQIERALEERGAGKSVRRLILEAMEGK